MKIREKDKNLCITIEVECPVKEWKRMTPLDRADFIADEVNTQLALSRVIEEEV